MSENGTLVMMCVDKRSFWDALTNERDGILGGYRVVSTHQFTTQCLP